MTAKNKQIDTGSLLEGLNEISGSTKGDEASGSEMALPALDVIKSSAPQPTRKREMILSLDPRICRRWQYYDRFPEWFSYEHCSDIISDFRNGKEQEIPGIVRVLENDPEGFKYEVVFGGRRHFSAFFVTEETGKEFSFKATVRDISDQEAARLMDLENRKRKDISDFERCVSYRQQVGKTKGYTSLFGSYNDLLAMIEERDECDTSLSKAALSQMITAGELNEIKELICLFDGRRMQIPWSLAYHLVKEWNNKDGKGKEIIQDEIKLLSDNLEKMSPEAIIKRLLKAVASSKEEESKPRGEDVYEDGGRVIMKKTVSAKDVVLKIPLSLINDENANKEVLIATFAEIVENN